MKFFPYLFTYDSKTNFCICALKRAKPPESPAEMGNKGGRDNGTQLSFDHIFTVQIKGVNPPLSLSLFLPSVPSGRIV
jgi:hypothetical protein